MWTGKAFKSALPQMPEIREPFVEGINRQFRLAAQFLSVVTFFLITGCSMVDLGFSPKSTLWELKEKAVTIYLLGSMHLLPENAYPLPVEMERAFQNSNRIVFEVDLGMASPDRISKAYQSVAAYPPNDDLSHHVSAETLSELRLVLNYLGLSFEAAQRLRAAFLAGVITDRLAQRAGFREEFGVDRHFYREAVQAKKTVTGLETLQAQTSVYSLDDRQSENHLRLAMENLLTCPILLNQMEDAWKAGDADGLDQLLNGDQMSEPVLDARMFGSRNDRWLAQIERMLHSDEKYLIIVGAGHLVGKNGLVETLRRRGYRVRQL